VLTGLLRNDRLAARRTATFASTDPRHRDRLAPQPDLLCKTIVLVTLEGQRNSKGVETGRLTVPVARTRL
jgi:hypothetical protein